LILSSLPFAVFKLFSALVLLLCASNKSFSAFASSFLAKVNSLDSF
jgi:hypothetical protein